MYGHSLAVLAALGSCSDDPTCTRPVVTTDDTNPAVRRCAHHAITHLKETTR